MLCQSESRAKEHVCQARTKRGLESREPEKGHHQKANNASLQFGDFPIETWMVHSTVCVQSLSMAAVDDPLPYQALIVSLQNTENPE